MLSKLEIVRLRHCIYSVRNKLDKVIFLLESSSNSEKFSLISYEQTGDGLNFRLNVIIYYSALGINKLIGSFLAVKAVAAAGTLAVARR